jgi:DNA-binding XRE family transcriptional regulator
MLTRVIHSFIRVSNTKGGETMGSLFDGLDTTDKIRGLLASRNHNQPELAKILDVTSETISNRMRSRKWEIGELKKIAEAYGVDVYDLI